MVGIFTKTRRMAPTTFGSNVYQQVLNKSLKLIRSHLHYFLFVAASRSLLVVYGQANTTRSQSATIRVISLLHIFNNLPLQLFPMGSSMDRRILRMFFHSHILRVKFVPQFYFRILEASEAI